MVVDAGAEGDIAGDRRIAGLVVDGGDKGDGSLVHGQRLGEAGGRVVVTVPGEGSLEGVTARCERSFGARRIPSACGSSIECVAHVGDVGGEAGGSADQGAR